MGYRSDVAFCISVDSVLVKPETGESYWNFDKEKFKEMVGFFKLTKFYELATDAEYDLIKGKEPSLGWREGDIIFYAQNWKWYPDYPLVQAFDDMWHSMQDIEGISGYAMRVGEGDGDEPDIETQEFGDDPSYEHFGVSTSMYFNDDCTLGETKTDEEAKEQVAT
jgi:hypothetical protein